MFMVGFSNPLIGVFTNNGVIRKLNKQKRNFKSYFRIDFLTKESIKADIPLYFFSIYDVDFKNSTVRGTYFNQHKGIWKKKKFPLPDILYDKGGGFLKSQKKKAKRIRRKFSELGIKTLNSQHYFDKWITYKSLKMDPEILPHLPQTERCDNLNDLKAFMNGKDKIYIKGIYGSRGKKVVCLKKTEDGIYELNYFIEKLVSRKEQSLEDVYDFLTSFLGNEKFIIQQAISLMVINDKLIDFRAELQRNKSGELEVVAVPVRFGVKQSPITIHSEAYSFDEFFRKFFNYSENEIIQKKNEVDNFLKKVYESVEAYFGPFGEIGIDFGMDDQGDLWLIECNAKSAKVSLCKAYDEETVKKAFLNPLEYAKFIYNKPFIEFSNVTVENIRKAIYDYVEESVDRKMNRIVKEKFDRLLNEDMEDQDDEEEPTF